MVCCKQINCARGTYAAFNVDVDTFICDIYVIRTYGCSVPTPARATCPSSVLPTPSCAGTTCMNLLHDSSSFSRSRNSPEKKKKPGLTVNLKIISYFKTPGRRKSYVSGIPTQNMCPLFSNKILCTLFPFCMFLAAQAAICFGKLCQSYLQPELLKTYQREKVRKGFCC